MTPIRSTSCREISFSSRSRSGFDGDLLIVAGEASVYTILAFVAMKMEMSWRNAPFRNSGFRKLKPFAGYFTHET